MRINIIILVIACAISFLGGYFCKPEIKKVEIAKISVEDVKKTTIEYKKKISKSDADIDAKIGKTDLKVSINGVEQVIHKTDTEKYALDENKLELTQESKATISIKTEQVDLTRKWRIGAGYSNHGFSALVNFPVYNYVGGYSYFDSQTISAGLSIAF